jgi:hypothetical protein
MSTLEYQTSSFDKARFASARKAAPEKVYDYKAWFINCFSGHDKAR